MVLMFWTGMSESRPRTVERSADASVSGGTRLFVLMLKPQSGPLTHLPVQHAYLGRRCVRLCLHAKNTPLKGLRFESPGEAQTYLDRWEQKWADTRIHGTSKRQVAAMFAEEKPP